MRRRRPGRRGGADRQRLAPACSLFNPRKL